MEQTLSTVFPLYNLKIILLILLIISIPTLCIINKRSGLKNWWILPLIALMVLAIFLHGLLADLNYELDDSINLSLFLGYLIGTIAIARVSRSVWIFVILFFGGLLFLSFAEELIGVWIGIILAFVIIWLYGLSIRKLDEKSKSEKASIGIIKHIPIIIVGLSYVVVAGAKLVQILMNNHFNPYLFVPETLWVLLGIAIVYQKRAAILLSLVSYPLVFGVENLPLSINLIKDINFMTPFFYTPFHYISFIIFQKYGLLYIVKTYWMIYLWGIYGIHSICLLPYFLKKSKKVQKTKKIRKPEKDTVKFRFPDVVHIYQKNAFQVLGLVPQKATTSMIARRKKDLSALIGSDLPPMEHFQDFWAIPWPGASQITESDINNAYSRLQDNLKRIKEELFWFHFEEDKDEAFGYLLEGDFQRGRELWKAKKEQKSKSYNSALALHNLAVLGHALVLTEELTNTGNPGLSNAQIDNWEKIFTLWREVGENPKCWDYFKQRIIYLNDPRINDRYVRRLRGDLPGAVLKVNLELARVALAQKMFEYAKQHLDLIRNSGFDSKDISKMVEAFFAIFVRDLKAIRQDLESQPNDREKYELYEEYELVLGKALKVKDRVDKFDGSPSIKGEIDKIISIMRKQIRNDLNSIKNNVDKELDCVNFLINMWEKESDLLKKSMLIIHIKEKSEKSANKLRNLRDEFTDIVMSDKEMLKKMNFLCCDDESRRQIENEDELLENAEAWINKTVADISQIAGL